MTTKTSVPVKNGEIRRACPHCGLTNLVSNRYSIFGDPKVVCLSCARSFWK